MKYTRDVYEDFGNFFAKANEIAKDKAGLYNQLLSPPMRKKTDETGFQNVIGFLIYVLRYIGWIAYVAIAGLVGLGFYAYFGGMGTLIASNPVLAAAIAALGAQSIYLIWKHKEFVLSQKAVGDEYKTKFELIRKSASHASINSEIESLMKQCVASLCIHAYQANSDDVHEKIISDV